MTTPVSGPSLAAPALVDAHIHPDKTTWGTPWQSRKPAQTLAELIQNDRDAEFDTSTEERAHALLSNAVANGTLAMRAHVDVASHIGVDNVVAVRAAADRLAPFLTVQIVAFPQFGLLTNSGTLEMMRESLNVGADLVGGIDPAGVDGDVEGHLDAVFGLAGEAGRDVDIHLHDGGDVGLMQIREIARRTVGLGMQGRVTIGHAFAACDTSLPRLRETLDRVAEAGVWLTTCALGPDPVPDLDLFEQHGVRLALGSDGVRDSWSPFGTGSMVDRAHLLGYRTGALTDADLERCYRLASTAGGELLGVPDLARWAGPGFDTRLEFEANSIAQLVVDRPAPRRVIRRGVNYTG
ncbi:amidohydrolase family protein [Glaciibacter psychrotolerans]|uniref:Cytosine deaminase n=1 Tax=Glaciibacter psychrotolerans TaxID=670054 RepID=A0A7Z0EBJ0_9MICO|nr:cytosine deaminase [Leifsonia psychrotolerans]